MAAMRTARMDAAVAHDRHNIYVMGKYSLTPGRWVLAKSSFACEAVPVLIYRVFQTNTQ